MGSALKPHICLPLSNRGVADVPQFFCDTFSWPLQSSPQPLPQKFFQSTPLGTTDIIPIFCSFLSQFRILVIRYVSCDVCWRQFSRAEHRLSFFILLVHMYNALYISHWLLLSRLQNARPNLAVGTACCMHDCLVFSVHSWNSFMQIVSV